VLVAEGLEQAAAELYALAPGDFTAARNARAAEAKSAGDRDLATGIRGLTKPSVAAWAVNALVRHRADDVSALLEVGERMRDATASGDRDAVRQLGRDRQHLLASAAHEARALGEELGVNVSEAASVEVQQTLQAAVVDPAAAAAVRSGLLVRTFSSSGLDPVDLSGAVAIPDAAPAVGGAGSAGGAAVTVHPAARSAEAGGSRRSGSEASGSRRSGSEASRSRRSGPEASDRVDHHHDERAGGRRSADDRRRADEERKREAAERAERATAERAERALATARRDAEEARQDADDADAEVATLDLRIRENRARHEELAEEQQELRERLEQVQADLTDTNVTAARLRKERTAAERTADSAHRAATRARTRLDRLQD
jgi:hypothetical protein